MENQLEQDEDVGDEKHTIFSTNGDGVPIRHRAGYNYPPTWLRSNSQIYATPPQVHIDSLSLHILDQGYGAHALLTVRQIDPEKQKRFTLEQQSRAGVLGRITSGVWVKLAEVGFTFSPASFFPLITFILCAGDNEWKKRWRRGRDGRLPRLSGYLSAYADPQL